MGAINRIKMRSANKGWLKKTEQEKRNKWSQSIKHSSLRVGLDSNGLKKVSGGLSGVHIETIMDSPLPMGPHMET